MANQTIHDGTAQPQADPNGGLSDGGFETLSSTSGATSGFALGTLLRTSRGEVLVEALSVGDLVLTTGGARRPIAWLGQRIVDCRDHPRPRDVLPVRIFAHAFGDSLPARDLFVSPSHAICVDVLREVLIPAGALVNGSTVQQIDVDDVTYWQVELESHDVILAESQPAESCLDTGEGGVFREAGVAGPDAPPTRRTQARACRSVHDAGPLVAGVKAQLRRRAIALGWTRSSDPELRLEVDGERLDPVVRGLTARFAVPAGAQDLSLVSQTARPCDVLETEDSRDLGICLEGIAIDDGFGVEQSLPLDDPRLGAGLHAIEDGCRRWTTGRMPLPADLTTAYPDGFFLRLQLAGPALPRWVAPATVAARAERLRLVRP